METPGDWKEPSTLVLKLKTEIEVHWKWRYRDTKKEKNISVVRNINLGYDSSLNTKVDF